MSMPEGGAGGDHSGGQLGDAGTDTFPKLLLQNSAQRGGRPAIREKFRGIWRTMTWRELAEEAALLAAALAAQGLRRGDHVAFLGDNRPRLYAALCATHWLGAIAVPLYQRATAQELAPLLQSSEVTHVFAEDQEQVDKLLEIRNRCPTIRCVVFDKERGMRHYKQPGLVSYDAVLEQGRQAGAAKQDFMAAEARRGSGEETSFLLFTSGTTGPAKGVVFTHAALIDRARMVATTDALSETDVAMAYLPPGWIGQTFFGYVMAMVAGYCVCCPESSQTMLADMREIAPTCFLATPRVLEALLTQVSMRLEDFGGFNRNLYRRCIALGQRVGSRILSGGPVAMGDRLAHAAGDILIFGPLRDVLGMSRVRVAYAAGDAIAPDLLLRFRALGINLKQLYGSTETGFLVAMQRNGEVKLDTVGPAANGVELRFTPQREILVRSPGLFKEYHRDPGTTAQARSAEGWFHTGDAGYLGEDGHLRIIDRIANIGALNDGTSYSPKILENRLKVLPEIKEAVAFGNGRDMVCVLVDIETSVAGRWADRRFISYTGHADLASRDEIYALIGASIAKINSELAQLPALAKSQIHRFAILPKELTADDGMLTRAGKLRRAAIAAHYRLLIEAIYQGRSEASIDIDPGGQPISTELKIRDATVVAPERVGRAA